MKTKFQLLLASFSFFFLAACQSGGEQKESTTDNVEVAEDKDLEEESGINATFLLDSSESIIRWEGTKKFLDSGHNGTLRFESGSVLVTDGKVNEGAFIVDMTTLDNNDLEGTEEEQKLLGHLRSDDFFGVDKHPQASFELNSAAPSEDPEFSHVITGTLTIKDTTNTVTFPANVEFDNETLEAEGKLVFDRTRYDIRYGSDDFMDVVKDKAISNDVTLDLRIKAKVN